MKSAMLPYEPESFSGARTRAHLALTPALEWPPQGDPPGTKRKHVFDFRTGWRMILTLENHPDGPQKLHISASGIPHMKQVPAIQYLVDFNGEPMAEPVTRLLRSYARNLVLDQESRFDWEKAELFIGDPPKRVPHLYVPVKG